MAERARPGIARRRRLRPARPLRAADLPPRADGRLRHPRAALLEPAQPVQRHAPGVDLRPPGDRHDLRHPDPRHRSLRRLADRAHRPGRCCRRQGRLREPLRRRHRRRGRGLWLAPGVAGCDRRRHGLRLPPGHRHHQAQGAALRRDAGRHVGVSRCRPPVRRRRADLGLRRGLSLVGPGLYRPGAGAGDHLRGGSD